MKKVLLLVLATSLAHAAQAPLRPIRAPRTPPPLKNLLLQELAHKSVDEIQNLIQQRIPADLYLDLAAVLLFANNNITIPLLGRKQLLELMAALTPYVDHQLLFTYLAQCLDKSYLLSHPEQLAHHGSNAIINMFEETQFSPSKRLVAKKKMSRSWLTQAIADNNIQAVWFLLENSADPNMLTKYDDEAISPIAVAVLNNNMPALAMLLNYNAVLTHPAHSLYTQPLFLALKHNKLDIADYIFSRLENPIHYLNTTYNVGSNSGITMLDALNLYTPHFEQAIQWLRDHGARTNYINPEEN